MRWWERFSENQASTKNFTYFGTVYIWLLFCDMTVEKCLQILFGQMTGYADFMVNSKLCVTATRWQEDDHCIAVQ